MFSRSAHWLSLSPATRRCSVRTCSAIAASIVLNPASVRRTRLPRRSAGLGSVEEPTGIPPRQQRQDHLREQDRLQVRLGRLRLGQPPLEIGDALVGDGIALALGPLASLGADHNRPAIPLQPAQGGVHVPERHRLVSAETLVEGPLELIAV
jgi:hypothetical protein